MDGPDELQPAVFGLIQRARQVVGESEPLSSIERELATTATLPTFEAEVLSARDLTPNLREVVVGGPGLAGFSSVGGDQFVWIMVPRSGAEPLPAGYSMADWMAGDPQTRPYGAYYTVRAWESERAEMVLWAVDHHQTGGVGGWLTRCTPGERLAIWGPREGAGAELGGRRPRHHLFVTDESGFCAVVVLLEELARSAPGDPATVVAETVDAAHEIEFPGSATTVYWHHRGTELPGTGTALCDLVREVAGTPSTAFGAGESRQMAALRRYFRHELGMPSSAVSMTGYWRRE